MTIYRYLLTESGEKISLEDGTGWLLLEYQDIGMPKGEFSITATPNGQFKITKTIEGEV